MSEGQWPLAPLPWQGDAWSRIAQLDDSSRLPHALLLSGASGIGKHLFLQAASARLLCESPVDGLACGRCKSCDLLQAGSHADFLKVAPEEGSRVIKIDQVRQLIDFANRTPSLGDRKLVLLGPGEAMNINAANALLKCLEEPSASTTILVYSHQPSGMPATVRSRCQALVMPTPDPEASVAWLAQICGDQEQARQLLQLCSGRPVAAEALFREGDPERRQAMLQGIEALLAGRLSALEFPALVADEDLADVIALMQRQLEANLQRVVTAGGQGLRDGFLLRDELARLQRAVANGANPNRQLIIEDCSARLAIALGPTRT